MASKEAVQAGTGARGKKWLRRLWKSALGVVIGIAAFMAVVFVVNLICLQTEQGKIKAYGQEVSVNGKNMNVLIQGDGDETIVLLPGYGTAAPALDFKKLVDELSPFYKMVVVEPFGYGLSDGTDKERSVENIASELHTALQQLEVKRYILMGHSIAGIYGMYYVNQYPDEVSAFVGIDSSVPNQPGIDAELPGKTFEFLKKSGLQRLLLKVSGNPFANLDFDDETKEQMLLITLRGSNNSTVLNEMKHISSNFKKAQQLTFPRSLPLLLFLQNDNQDVEGWTALHEEKAKGSAHGKAILMEGSHYLHHTKSKEIAENVRAFMKELALPKE